MKNKKQTRNYLDISLNFENTSLLERFAITGCIFLVMERIDINKERDNITEILQVIPYELDNGLFR